MDTRRTAWIAALVALLLAAAAGAWWLRMRPVPVPALPVHAGPMVQTVLFSARASTRARVELGATLTGRVRTVRVREGDRVARDQVLVEIEADELRAALEQAQAQALQARARVGGLRGSGRQSAQAALAQAEANVRAAQAERQRAEDLVARGFVSAARLDEAQRALEVARAQQLAAEAPVRALAERGTDLEQAQAQAALADAAVAAARARLAQATLRAPEPGQVLERLAEPGQIVQPGRALLRLALEGPLELVAAVDERFLEQLRPGQRARAVADAFPGRVFDARVRSLAPLVDAQRGSVEVKLAIDGTPPEFLREDLTLSVEVQTAQRPKALVVPLAALRSGGAADLGAASAGATADVWRLGADGRAEARRVRLGLRTLEAAEVLDGLAEGDVLLVPAAGQTLAAGQRVAPDRAAGDRLRSTARAEDAGRAIMSGIGR